MQIKEILQSYESRIFHKGIFLLQGLYGHLKQEVIADIWLLLYENYRINLSDVNALVKQQECICKGLFELLKNDFCIDSEAKNIKTRIEDTVSIITFEDFRLYISNGLLGSTHNGSVISNDFDDELQEWTKWFRIFVAIDTKNAKLASKWKDNKELNRMYTAVLLSTYQEFWHSVSHLFMVYNNQNNKDAIIKSINHLQRACMDLVKKSIDCLKLCESLKKNEGLECRLNELTNVSTMSKYDIIGCYQKILKSVI